MIGTVHQHWTPYCGAAPSPGDWLGRWNFDPLLLLALLVGAVCFHCLSGGRQRKAEAAAITLLLLLFVSPFCALTSALFAARVAHHVLLTAVVAPLIVLALPGRLRLPGTLSFWTAAQAIIFWLWHAPPLYAAALSSHLLYWVMQLSLIGSALGFWRAVRRASEPGAVAALLLTMVQMGLLGALITFAGAPLYAPHLLTTVAWGFTPLEDQQLAGLIMWAPSAGLYLGAALFLASRWLARDGRGLAS